LSYVDSEMMLKHDDRGTAAAEASVSLGSDAWRLLRRDKVAMLSLAILITIGLLAFFTPLLPLQPPDRDQTKLQYAPPSLSPIFE
jgi:oligopeptide transport system permease protein